MTRQRWLVVFGGLAYVVACGVAAGNLTFYWDDHFFILTQLDRGLAGALTTGINGHWWPLATLILYVETHVFGFWYPGYIIVNAIIVVATALLAFTMLESHFTRHRWLLMSGLVIFATSFGVVVNVLVITTSWPLSVALAMLTALLVTRGHRARVWGLALAACFLSGSGLFFVNTVSIAALVLVAGAEPGDSPWYRNWRELRRSLALVTIGAIGTLLGRTISSVDPINYYTPSRAVVDSGDFPVIDLLDTASAVFSFTIAWMASPALPGSLVVPTAMPWLMILITTYTTLVMGLVALGLVGIAALRRQGGRWWLAVKGLGTSRILTLLAPIAATALTLMLVRGSSLYAPRFWLLWLIPATVFWALGLRETAETAPFRLATRALRTLVVLSAVIGVLAMPWTLRNATDVDKQRWMATTDQLEQARACLRGRSPQPDPVIAPAVSPINYCRLVTFLHSESLTGRMGYPN